MSGGLTGYIFAFSCGLYVSEDYTHQECCHRYYWECANEEYSHTLQPRQNGTRAINQCCQQSENK